MRVAAQAGARANRQVDVNGDGSDVGEVAPFEGDGETPVGGCGGPGDQPAGPTRGQRECDRGAQHRKDEALGKQLPGDADAARADCKTNADFLRTRGGATQHQVGKVAARNQEHQAGDAGQHPERASEALLQNVDSATGGLQLDAVVVLRGLRGLHRKSTVERVERAFGLAGGDAGAQAAHHGEPGMGGRIEPVGRHELGLETDWQPDIGNGTHGFPEEFGRSHADYGTAGSIDFEDLADGRRTAPELAIPESVAQNDDGRGGGAVIGLGEDAAGVGGDAEDLEVVSGDDGAPDRA